MSMRLARGAAPVPAAARAEALAGGARLSTQEVAAREAVVVVSVPEPVAALVLVALGR